MRPLFITIMAIGLLCAADLACEQILNNVPAGLMLPAWLTVATVAAIGAQGVKGR